MYALHERPTSLKAYAEVCIETLVNHDMTVHLVFFLVRLKMAAIYVLRINNKQKRDSVCFVIFINCIFTCQS